MDTWPEPTTKSAHPAQWNKRIQSGNFTAQPDLYQHQTRKGGKIEMADLPLELEQSRLLNLIRGFGWEMKEQKLNGDELIITVSKKVVIEEQPIVE